MGAFSTARGRRTLFVVVIVVVLAFPLVSALVTRARLERSGVDVTATVLDATRKDDGYLLAFRLPEEIDPDQATYSATVGRATYEKATETRQVTVRVLEERPEAHRVEGEISSNTTYVVMGATIAVVLVLGLWWARTGRRRPTVRIRANAPLAPADAAEVGTLGRDPGEDVYEAVGTVLSADDSEVVLDIGERQVVVVLAGQPNLVAVGAPARARGLVIG